MGVVTRGYGTDTDAVRNRLRRILLEYHLGRRVGYAIEGGGPPAAHKVRQAAAAIERLVTS